LFCFLECHRQQQNDAAKRATPEQNEPQLDYGQLFHTAITANVPSLCSKVLTSKSMIPKRFIALPSVVAIVRSERVVTVKLFPFLSFLILLVISFRVMSHTVSSANVKANTKSNYLANQKKPRWFVRP